MSELKAEKLKQLLTLEEQNRLLDDLLILEAVVVAFQEYAKSIGKEKEAHDFVQKFMNQLTSERMKKIMSSKNKNKFDA